MQHAKDMVEDVVLPKTTMWVITAGIFVFNSGFKSSSCRLVLKTVAIGSPLLYLMVYFSIGVNCRTMQLYSFLTLVLE